MKRVVIVRHAKSVPYGYDDDFNRGLKERGFKDARLICNKLSETGVLPELIITSPAKRALMTAKIFAEKLNYSKSKIRLEDNLYGGFGIGEFVSLLNDLNEDFDNVFIFGHNPSMYYYCHNLCPTFNGLMPTTSTVGIDFDDKSWRDVAAGKGELAFHYIPRQLK